MYNPSGFDDSDLLLDPEARQRSMPGSAQNQGDKVSEPYRQAMMMAAAKTNPMNAVSQEPGMDFLNTYKTNMMAQMSEKDIDKMLIKEINRGSFGQSQRLEDAKNTMINRISGAGVPLRGV